MARRGTTILLLVAAAGLLAACVGTTEANIRTADGPGAVTPTTATPGGAGDDADEPDSPDTDPAGPRRGEATGEPVTIAFGGDASFEGLEARLKSDPRGVLSAIAPVLSAADLAMVNVEAAVTTGGGRPSAKTFNFRTPPEALTALKAAGVDVVTLANNHGMDFGLGGLEQSLAASRSTGMPMIGIGMTESEAFAPWIAEVRGRRIAFISATDVLDGNLAAAWTAGEDTPGLASAKRPERLVRAIEEVRGEVDTVVVYLHWGTEKLTCPNDRQPPLARALVDAGADVVVGAHSHRLVGGGYLDGAFVHYGLGNFIFKAPSEAGTTSGVITVTVDGRTVTGHEWTPARIRNLVPVPLAGDEARRAVAAWEDLRSCTDLSATPTT